MTRGKYWWIKERINPQLGTYYVPCENISIKDAKKMEDSVYGNNIMHKFHNKDEYESKLKELEDNGETVHYQFIH